MSNEELMQVQGGAFSATMLNAIVKAVNTVFELGQTVGSAIRRLSAGSICKVS